MGGDHGHGGKPYHIPDYREFSIEGIEKLESLEKALAQKGLRDPWIRNEAWRYHRGFGTPAQRAKNVFFRGLGVGIALTVLTIAYDKTLGSGNGHGHHDHHSDH